jgi:hypothetical protein
MALTQITPIEARVRWDRRLARPASVAWGEHLVRVVGISAIRDERSAYPADRGPRVTYLLQTDAGGQAAVAFDGRRRRWFVEALDRAA